MFIMVISVMLINTLVKPEQQAGWLKNAKAKPILDSLSKKVWETLSPNTDYILEKIDNILEKDMHKNMPTQNEDMPLQNNEGYSTE
ncbi:Colicin V production protein [Bartonella ancashensis]|uniref:Colicin V production protein n=2 Tax=Bartonella ancashensis TaxID=1318743 RepID=A0A0M5KUQ9_9HYPH|nr:Colicin V production protein [Bartonella ancashensis]